MPPMYSDHFIFWSRAPPAACHPGPSPESDSLGRAAVPSAHEELRPCLYRHECGRDRKRKREKERKSEEEREGIWGGRSGGIKGWGG